MGGNRRRMVTTGRGGNRTVERLLERLEARYALSAAFDVVGLTALRSDPSYASVDGSGVGVAIIDTGVYSAHPDIAGNFAAWYDAVTRTSAGTPRDPDGHGTHVAGTAAASNPSIGVATKARIIGIRGLPDDNERRPSHDPVATALQWVIDHHSTHNIKVVNMSLGVPGVNINTPQPRTDAMASRIAQLESLGITVVTASGNGYADFAVPGASIPAIHSTIQVANTWEDNGAGDDLPGIGAGGANSSFAGIDFRPRADQFSATSQRSTLPNQVAAPGSTIYSAWNGSGGKLYNTISGTSMASPLVAGMVALMQDAAFTFGGYYLSTSDVVSIIRTTADEIVDADTDTNGRAPIQFDHAGRASLGPAQPLAETGQTYKRVNIDRAVRQVVAQVQGGTINNPPPPNLDTNSTISNAVEVPALNGTRVFEYSGSIGTDGTVQVGLKDIDLYSVTLRSPGNLVAASLLTPAGVAGTVAIRLFSGTGAELSRSVGTPGSPYPTHTSARLLPGTYYIGVSATGNTGYLITSGAGAADGAAAADYTIRFSLTNPDPNGVVQGAVPFEGLPNSYPGFIGADLGLDVGPQDVDFFEIIAPDDGLLIIDIEAQEVYGAQAVDSYVRVFNEQLQQIAFNDDESSSNTDSYLEVFLTRGQRVYVAVADYWNRNFNPADPFDRSASGTGGFYDLYLRFDNSDRNGTVLSAQAAAIGSTLLGVVGSDNNQVVGADGSLDVDFFEFAAAENSLIELTLTAMSDGFIGSVSVWVYNPEVGDVLRLAESTGAVVRLVGVIEAGETVYVAVTGRGNTGFNWFAPASGTGGSTGTYTLTTATRPLTDLRSLNNDSVLNGTPTPITVGTPLAESIGSDGGFIVGAADVDVFVFTPSTSGSVVIRTSSPALLGVDTYLRVFDSAGNQIAANDDISAWTLESGLIVSVVSGVTYYIGVSASGPAAAAYSVVTGDGAEPSTTGDYILSIVPGGPFTAGADGRVSATAGVTGSVTVTSVNLLGMPFALRQESGQAAWTGNDLQAKTGSPLTLGDVATWVDPKDGRFYAAARTINGLGLFTNTGGSSWTFRNLSQEVAHSPSIAGELTVFVSIDGLVNLVGVASNGDLVRFVQTGASAAAGFAWEAFNLGDDLRSQSLEVPRFAGRITSFVTSWNALNVVGLDESGQIQAVWYHHSLALPKWTTNNLSAQTGAPVLSGGLTVWLTAWNAINIGGADSSGKLSVTWWLPEFGALWRTTNMTDLIGGPLLEGDSVSSFVTPWGAMNIAGREPDGTISVYWWEPVGNLWQIARISDAIQDATPMTGSILGLTTSGTFTINLLGTTAAGDVIRYWWSVGTGVWAEENMTRAAVVA
ncbi:MAG: S8 family serine peptidase [Phycisphaerae bacterium]|nr:S8 family serine peptidase [Phycisphaerae bacterium]